MYLEHFGLSEPPFRITPHTDFFFAGANRGATLDALIYAITHDEGIVKVSGEVGSGKTMLCRVLMERLPDNVTTLYLANPSLSRDDILYAIADELRLDIPDNARNATVLRSLQDYLIRSFSEGRQIVVLIDEAHAMPAETLEEIRLLSNLESNRNKLLQLVLFGQPELNEVLSRSDMRQLKERITHNFALEPLVRDDIASYLDFRLRAAGYRGPNLFAPAAVKLIAQSSLGLTRRINILADKALLAAFSSGSHQIGTKEVQAAIRDCDFSDTPYVSAPKNRRALAAGALAVSIMVIGSLLWANRPTAKPPLAPPTPAVTPAIAPAIAQSPPPAPPAAAPATKIPPAAATEAPASPPAKAAENADNALPVALQQRVDATTAWLNSAPDERWFLQLLASDADQREQIEAYVRKLTALRIDMSKLRIYYSELSGKPRYGVIYGDYPTRDAALAAARKLPPTLRAGHPYPRQVKKLR